MLTAQTFTLGLGVGSLALAAAGCLYALGAAAIARRFAGDENPPPLAFPGVTILEPDLAILDETDSGLDIDALRVVAKGVQEVRHARPELGVLLITHYQRILSLLRPDRVHILLDGRIVDSGGPELAERLEQEGYEAWR